MADPDGKTDGGLLALVGDIYDCAIEPKRWAAALERLAALLESKSAAISLHTAENPVALRASWGIEPKLEEAMTANFAINPLVPAQWFSGIGEPFTALEFVGEDQLKNSRWFKQAVAPFGIGDALCAFLAKSTGQFGAISLFRAEENAAYAEKDVAVLRALAPHIRRSVMIADLLDARALERDTLANALDLLMVGIVLTDQAARIVHANQAALRLLDGAAAIRREGDQLGACDPECAAELREAIAAATSGGVIHLPNSGIAVSVKAHDGRDLAAWVLPLDSGLRGDLGATFAARAAVFVRELGDTSPFPAELFVRRYGVTPAECRILMLLTQGMTAREAAETLGISLATAKTHIARLFEKTGTQRQTDLLRLVMSAFAPARG